MPFNFLPWRAKRDRQRQIQFYGLLVLAGALTGSVQLWMFSNLESVARHQAIAIGERQTRLAEQEALLAEWTAKEVTLKEANHSIEAALALLGTFREARPSMGQWLVDLMAARPTGVWIEGVQIEPHRVDEVPTPSQWSTPFTHWQATLSGHAVLEADPMRYQEALARHFGDHRKPSVSAVSSNRPIVGPSDPSEMSIPMPFESPGLKSFSIEQWLVSERH